MSVELSVISAKNAGFDSFSDSLNSRPHTRPDLLRPTFTAMSSPKEIFFFFFSSRRRHTRYWRDWSSDVCSSDLETRIRSSPSRLRHQPPFRLRPTPEKHEGRLPRLKRPPFLSSGVSPNASPLSPTAFPRRASAPQCSCWLQIGRASCRERV